jgi:hypothetical protein
VFKVLKEPLELQVCLKERPEDKVFKAHKVLSVRMVFLRVRLDHKGLKELQDKQELPVV